MRQLQEGAGTPAVEREEWNKETRGKVSRRSKQVKGDTN